MPVTSRHPAGAIAVDLLPAVLVMIAAVAQSAIRAGREPARIEDAMMVAELRATVLALREFEGVPADTLHQLPVANVAEPVAIPDSPKAGAPCQTLSSKRRTQLRTPQSPERRTPRWHLGGRVVLAVPLIVTDLGPTLPGLFLGSDAQHLTQCVVPGDPRRQYGPTGPLAPGFEIYGDMPRRLTALPLTEGDLAGLGLHDAILSGDDAQIVAELRAAPPPAFVTLDSPGRSMSDALEIGRVICDLSANWHSCNNRSEAGVSFPFDRGIPQVASVAFRGP